MQRDTHVPVGGFDIRIPEGAIILKVVHIPPPQQSGSGQADKSKGEADRYIPEAGLELKVEHFPGEQGTLPQLQPGSTGDGGSSTGAGQMKTKQTGATQGTQSSVGGAQAQIGDGGTQPNAPTGRLKGDQTGEPHACQAKPVEKSSLKKTERLSQDFTGSDAPLKQKSVSFTMIDDFSQSNSHYAVKKAASETLSDKTKTEAAASSVPRDLDPSGFIQAKIATNSGQKQLVSSSVPANLDPSHSAKSTSNKTLNQNANHEGTIATAGKVRYQNLNTNPGREKSGNLVQRSGGATSWKMNDTHSDLSKDRNANKPITETLGFFADIAQYSAVERGEKQAAGASACKGRGTKRKQEEPLFDEPCCAEDITAKYSGLRDSLGHKSRFFMIKVDSDGKVHNTLLG